VFVNLPSRRKPGPPWATLLIVATCVVVFLWTMALPTTQRLAVLTRWGTVPSTLLDTNAHWLQQITELRAARLVTAIFFHADWLHITGNLLFLIVFGVSAERALGFARYLVLFVIGGVSGFMTASVPVDWQLTDTYFVVAHIHYVLIGINVFPVVGAVYFWFPKMTGRMLSERVGKWHFWLTVIGFNGTFFVQHFLGAWGMTRRVWTYPNQPHWATLNMISTVSAFVLGISVLIFLWNVYASRKHGEIAGDNPWEAWTLEWATSSPPPDYNFAEVPPILGRRPLWDLAHPELADAHPRESA